MKTEQRKVLQEINQISNEILYGKQCSVCHSRKGTERSEVGYVHPTNRLTHVECFEKTQKKNETGWAVFKFQSEEK